MVPLDGSDLSERALPYAVELARSLSLELLVVRAVTLDSSSYAYGGYFDLTKVSSDEVVPEATDYLDAMLPRASSVKGCRPGSKSCGGRLHTRC